MKTSRIGWFLILITTMFALVPIADAGNLGPPVVISDEVDDQQNPAVVALPDKDLWLVVWEDWRDYTLGRRGADIYAAFVKIEDGQGVVCGEPFAVNQDARAQSMPTAAYSQGFGKILVTWQDANKPYLKYRFIDVNDLTEGGCDGYVLYDVQNVPYNPVFDCTECVGSYTCRKEISQEALCAGAGGVYIDGTCVLTEVGTLSDCRAEGGTWADIGGTESECDDAGWYWDGASCRQCQLTDYAALCTEAGGFWNGTTCIEDEQTFSTRGSDVCQDRLYYLTDPNETIGYPIHSTCSSEILAQAVGGCASLGPEWVRSNVSSSTSGIGYETLGTRSRPRVIYNEFDDRFWFGWVDKRTGRTRFRYIAWCNVAADVLFGDGSFPAYGAISAGRVDRDDRWGNVRAADWIFPPDVFRNQVSAQGRLLTRTTSEDDEVRIYEFFDSTNSVDLAADSMSGEVYFVWEGEREEATVTVQCSERVVEFSSTSSPEGVHVFGIPNSYVPETGIHSLNISGDAASQYHPSVHFDPVTRRFLAAWEDTRDGANSKIYGQLIQAVSGSPYNANFLMMTAEERTLLGETFAEARQTAPAVGYDHTNQRFLVTWQDSRNGAVSEENIDIYAQYVDGEGSLRGQNHLISSADAGGFSAKGNQYAPRIAYNLGNHVFLCVWKDARNFDTISRSDLYGQPFTLGQPQLTILDADGNPIYPSVLKFGNLLVGEVGSKTISLENTGDAAQELCEITGLDDPFAFVSVESRLVDGFEDTCLKLSPRMSTSMTIEFAPTRSGSYVDGFVVKTAAGDQVVGVNGGAESLVTVDRGQLDFGDVLVGVSKTLSFRIYNRGDTAAAVLDISEPEDVFSVSGITTSTTIPAGGSLQVSVSFQPDAMGDFSSEISMIFSLGDLTISLKGRGVDSPVAFSPLSLDFGAVKVANEKSLVTQVQNVSGANVVIENIEAPSNPFSLDMETALPHTIAPGESLSFTVTFRPAAKGNFADDVVLTITSGGETFTANMPVSGAGMAYPLRFFSNIPGSTILYPGQKEIWAMELMGDGAALDAIREPVYGDFKEVVHQMPSLTGADGHYIYSLFFDEAEPAGKYPGQVRFDLDGAKQPVTQDFLITLKELPEAWEHCPSAPSLDVEIAGDRAYHIDLVDWLRKPIPVTLSMNWGCAPKDVTEGTLYFLVMWKGRFFYLDPATGRFMEGVRPTVHTGFPAAGSGTLNFNRIRPLGIDDYRGVWKFYLAVLPEGGKALFYGSAVLIIEEGTGGEVRDLG